MVPSGSGHSKWFCGRFSPYPPFVPVERGLPAPRDLHAVSKTSSPRRRTVRRVSTDLSTLAMARTHLIPSHARRGAIAMLPLALAVAPFGLVIGATVATASVADGVGLATAPLLYGGSAQLAAITLLSSGATAVTVIATVLVINSRLAVYGAALAPSLRDQPRWFRWVAAYFLVDPQYVVVTAPAGSEGNAPARRHFYAGAAVTLWMTWHVATVAGYLVGPVVPPSLGLDAAVPLYLAAVLAPRADTSPGKVAVVGAAMAAAVANGVPAGGGLVVGIAVGMVAAVVVEGHGSR